MNYTAHLPQEINIDNTEFNKRTHLYKNQTRTHPKETGYIMNIHNIS